MKTTTVPAPAKPAKVQNSDFRNPYYNAADAGYKMYDVAMASGDAALIALAIKLMHSVDAIYSHLNENYLWD